MRAAVIAEKGTPPEIREFREPLAQPGAVLIDVETAGLGGWDILGAYRLAIDYPCVLRGEGVGRAPDGRRVYFGERSISPFGAWAERTIVPTEEVWDVPDDVDDRTAITMAIAGTGAWIPLLKAEIKVGDQVLVLGATGALGQLALQFARIMGAGRVVGAARNAGALARLKGRGWADGVVQLGGDDDVAALKSEAGEGFDVVLDLVCGAPMLAALKATRWGARIVTIGFGAGPEIAFHMSDLLFRTLTLVGTGQRSPQDREQTWRHILQVARDHGVGVDYAEFRLDQVAEAWQAQKAAPHAKIVATVGP